jgi:histidyl-tRNA synthetase
MRRANRANARAAVLLGDDEVARHVATVRDLDSGDQVEVPISDPAFAALVARLKAFS